MSILGNLLGNLVGSAPRPGDALGGLRHGGPFGGDGPRGPSPQLHLPGQSNGPNGPSGPHGPNGTPAASPGSNGAGPGSHVGVGPPLPGPIAQALNQVTAPVSQLLNNVLGTPGPQAPAPTNPVLTPPSGGTQPPFNPTTLLAGPAQAAAGLPQTVANNVAAALGGLPPTVAQPVATALAAVPATATTATPAAAMLPAAPTAVASTATALAPTVVPTTAPAMAAPAAAVAAPTSAMPASAVPAAQGNPAATLPAAVRGGEPLAAAVPGRTDVFAQRADGALLANAGRNVAGNPAANVPLNAAPPPGTTQALSGNTALPLAVPASQSPGEARGNPLLAGGGDRANGLPMRPEGQTAIYTLDGLQRRPMRQRVLNGRLDALLAAFRGGQVEVRDVREEILRVTQWMYWILAIVAYASLALALVAFLPVGASVFEPAQRAVTSGTSLVIGLVAALASWWLARSMGPSDDGGDTPPSDDERAP